MSSRPKDVTPVTADMQIYVETFLCCRQHKGKKKKVFNFTLTTNMLLGQYIYIHTCMYIYLCKSICIQLSILYVYIYIFIYIHIY